MTRDDIPVVQKIVSSTGFFHNYEIEVAVELVTEAVENGSSSGYYFVLAESMGRCLGYACYGPIACTEGSYDLFWIVVDQANRGQGVGLKLLASVEELLKPLNARNIYAETSGRDQYSPTRRFYDRAGFIREATIKDFYATGDDKLIYSKRVT